MARGLWCAVEHAVAPDLRRVNGRSVSWTVNSLEYPDPTLTDGMVVLRPWAMTDLRCIEEAGWDTRIPTGTTVPSVYSEAEGRAFVQRQLGRQTKGEGLALAIADAASNEAVGQIVLLFRPQTTGVAGLGFWIIQRARRRGIATGAAKLLTFWALREGSLDRVEALVEPDNAVSVRVLEAVGFQREGLLRSYLSLDGRRADAFLYSMLPQDLGYGS